MCGWGSTAWAGGGMDPSSTGVFAWAYSNVGVDDPSDPQSTFQEHTDCELYLLAFRHVMLSDSFSVVYPASRILRRAVQYCPCVCSRLRRISERTAGIPASASDNDQCSANFYHFASNFNANRYSSQLLVPNLTLELIICRPIGNPL